MRPHPRQGQIRPQVSTMPRQQTEAAAYLDIYKLVNEKKRLEQELETLEQRRDRIQQRLQAIEIEVKHLETKAHDLRSEGSIVAKPACSNHPAQAEDFNMLFLEY